MKKIMQNVCFAVLLVLLLITFTGCSNSNDTANTAVTIKSNTSSSSSTTEPLASEDVTTSTTQTKKFLNELKRLTSDQVLGFAEEQMAMPNDGDQIAIIHIKNYGDVTIKFFDQVAPKAVENFVTHAKEGYYNGLTFHRIIQDFMIQGGDPNGDGTGGESIWGEGFAEELSAKVLPYRGSICMASSGTGTHSLGSQFFINTSNYSDLYVKYLSQYGLSNLNEANKKYGGQLTSLVGYAQYTTFGQVIDGMKIVDAISNSAIIEDSNGTVASQNQPVIESIEITTYKAN